MRVTLSILGLAVLLAIAGSPALAQESISGTVLDDEYGEPLEFVHVFIDGTSIGDVTASDGSFSLRLPPFRPFRLVISMLGFEMVAEEVLDDNQAANERTIRLVATTFELGEFVVEAEQPRAWRRNLDMLRELMFSNTEAGLRCEIENPEILDLDEDGGRLRARAQGPLRIVNPRLGYRVTIHGLELDGSRQNYRWTGRVQFDEIPDLDDDEMERVRRKRQDVYTGSMRHFLRALMAGRLREEGFDAALVQGPGRIRGAEPIQETGHSSRSGAPQILFGRPGADSRSLMYQGTLMVQYKDERESPVYLSWMESIAPDSPLSQGRDPWQTSWLDLPSGLAIIDTLGNVVSDGSQYPLFHYGYWAWERIGEMLPADWIPPAP